MPCAESEILFTSTVCEMNLRSQESLPQSCWQIPKPARILIRQFNAQKNLASRCF